MAPGGNDLVKYSATAQSSPDHVSVLGLAVNSHAMAVELRFIEEVFRSGYITQVPLAPPCMAGMTNLRGQVIALLDLAKLLMESTSSRRPLPGCDAILLRWQDVRAAILIDSTTGVIQADLDTFHPTAQGARTIFAGHFRLVEGRLDLLDVKKLVEYVRYQAAVGSGLEPR